MIRRFSAFVFCGAITITALAQDESESFTQNFPLDDCTFVPWGGNQYFDLTPGHILFIDSQACFDDGECEERDTVRITVTDETRDVTFEVAGESRTVTTRVIEEYEETDGELVEISRNFYSTCLPGRDVYYFGEDVDDYEDGVVVDNGGAWLAGVDGATPGIIMPGGAPLVGSRYFPEVAPDIALDQAEHAETGIEFETPAGTFQNCLMVTEGTPLDPDEESEKVYCPGLGLVFDDDIELVDFTIPANPLGDPAALSGLWFDPDLSGEGYNITVTSSGMVIYFYGYDTDGEQLWLISETAPIPNAYDDPFELNMRVAEGGTFGMPLEPATALKEWGTLSGLFTSCNAGGEWTLSGTDGDKIANVQKLAGTGALDCDY